MLTDLAMRQHKSFSPPQADSGAPSVSAHRRQQASASTSAALLLLSFLMFAPASHAEGSGELRFLSEHIHRGYSSSRGDPSVQAELRYLDASGWVAGASISRVAFDDEDGDAPARDGEDVSADQWSAPQWCQRCTWGAWTTGLPAEVRCQAQRGLAHGIRTDGISLQR